MRAVEIAPQYGFKLLLAEESTATPHRASDNGHGARDAQGQATHKTNPNAPRRTGFTPTVRDVYRAYTGDFSIRTVAADLKARHPEQAKDDNLMVNISAILGRAKEKKELLLVTQGAAGQPSVYRNVALSTGSNGYGQQKGPNE